MGKQRSIVVHAVWDEHAKVWVATSADVPGLATESSSLDLLVPKLQSMIPELLDANGYPDGEDIHFKIVGEVNNIVAHRVTA